MEQKFTSAIKSMSIAIFEQINLQAITDIYSYSLYYYNVKALLYICFKCLKFIVY